MEWYLIVAAVVTLMAMLLSYKLISKPQKTSRHAQTKDSVLFLGPCGSGKTCAFNRMRLGKVLSSVTSQTMDSAKLSIDGKSIKITDLPGHPRLRQQMADALKNAAAAVLFVDSTQFMDSVRSDTAAIQHRSDCADILFAPPPHTHTPILVSIGFALIFLFNSDLERVFILSFYHHSFRQCRYDVLTHEEFVQNEHACVLVACNKMDLVDFLGSTIDLVRAALERDLEQKRKNKSNSLRTTDGEETARFLGVDGQKFELKNAPIVVQFAPLEASNESLKNGLKDLQHFCVHHKLPERAPRKTASGN
jgi:signal recognition particle receptor subunit beta